MQHVEDLVGVIPFFGGRGVDYISPFLQPAVYSTHLNHSCWSISYSSCLLFRLYHKHRNVSRDLEQKILGSAHIVGNVLWHSLFHLATSNVNFTKQISETGLRYLSSDFPGIGRQFGTQCTDLAQQLYHCLTLILLTWRIGWVHNNARK